mgnify:CR=1 FL=1|jgi:hypothetical protein
MIITKIFQGLGNQFFQYAFGLARAKQLNTSLKIDSRYFEKHAEVTQWGYTYKRDFGLNRFNISSEEATEQEIDSVCHPLGKTLAQKLLNQYRIKLAPKQHKFFVKEERLTYNPKFNHLLNNTYVEGYFTDERYFGAVREQLQQEFTLKNLPSETNLKLIEKIQNCNSVCISIRRTNFLNNPLHGTCGEEYYYKAMDVIAERIENPVFFVFSDDNAWINRYFESKYDCVFVQHNFPDFYEDFRLMVNCKHHIIPNSTFPWWAAWLSDYSSKIVIAPMHWLNTTDFDHSSYVPSSWIKIDHAINTIFKGDKLI